MAREDGQEKQQPMSDARLAEIAQFVGDLRMIGELGTHHLEHDYVRDLLAEVSRLREQNAALSEKLDAEADYNAGHIERLRAREAALVALAEMVDACEVLWASVESPFDRRARMRVLANWSNPDRAVESIQKQARALLASADEAK